MPEENRSIVDDATRLHMQSIDASLTALTSTMGKILKLAKIAIALYLISVMLGVATAVFAIVFSNRAVGGFGGGGHEARNEARLEQLRQAREQQDSDDSDRGTEHHGESSEQDHGPEHAEEDEHDDEP